VLALLVGCLHVLHSREYAPARCSVGWW